MIRSLSRPVTNSSPSARKPRSPVRRNGPLAVRPSAPRRSRAVSSGRLPVAVGDARARDPDLADLARPRRARLDSGSTMAIRARPREPCRSRPGGATPAPSGGRHSAVPLELAGSKARHRGAPAPRAAAGDEQRRLGQAVAGIERLAPEAAGRERRGEALQRLGAHRLGAVEGHASSSTGRAPAAAPSAIFCDAQLVGEVGAAAGGRAVARDRLQPAHRLLEEGERATAATPDSRRRAAAACRRSGPCRGRAAAR